MKRYLLALAVAFGLCSLCNAQVYYYSPQPQYVTYSAPVATYYSQPVYTYQPVAYYQPVTYQPAYTYYQPAYVYRPAYVSTPLFYFQW